MPSPQDQEREITYWPSKFYSKVQVSNIENDNVESATSLVGEGFALHGHQNGMMKILKVSSQVKVRIIL